MGILGNILGNLADAALEKLYEKMSGNAVGIVFSNEGNSWAFNCVKGEMIKQVYYQTAQYLGIKELKPKTQGKVWDLLLFDDSYVDSAGEIQAFVLSNGTITVCYGLCGMGQNALRIEGENAVEFAKEMAKFLQELQINSLSFDTIQFYQADIPFHDIEWISNSRESILQFWANIDDYEEDDEDFDDEEFEEDEYEDCDNDEEDEDEETSVSEMWDSVKDYISSNFTAEYDEQFDILKLEFEVEENRTQLVMVGMIDSQLTIFSYIGDINKKDLQSAMSELSNMLVSARIIRDEQGHYLLQYIGDISEINAEKLHKLLQAIAVGADYFEQKYVGGDTF